MDQWSVEVSDVAATGHGDLASFARIAVIFLVGGLIWLWGPALISLVRRRFVSTRVTIPARTELDFEIREQKATPAFYQQIGLASIAPRSIQPRRWLQANEHYYVKVGEGPAVTSAPTPAVTGHEGAVALYVPDSNPARQRPHPSAIPSRSIQIPQGTVAEKRAVYTTTGLGVYGGGQANGAIAVVRAPLRKGWGDVADGIAVVVGGFYYRSNMGRFTPAPRGYQFVVLGIRVVNGSAGSIHVNPLNVTLVDQQGSSYAYHSATHAWCTPPLEPVDVRPGDHAQGTIAFLISAATGPASLVFRTSTGTEVVVDLERAPTY
jgi:hypothetical protein